MRSGENADERPTVQRKEEEMRKEQNNEGERNLEKKGRKPPNAKRKKNTIAMLSIHFYTKEKAQKRR